MAYALENGIAGIMGFSKAHAFEYRRLDLPANQRDAFHIQGSNGEYIYVMKTCGNVFYTGKL